MTIIIYRIISYNSTEEFIEKAMKTDAFYKQDRSLVKLDSYFTNNKITKEKLDLVKNRTHLNLSKYRNLIKNNALL